MNVFDFDNTIFRGDSTVRFVCFCFLRVPRLWLQIPGQAGNLILFALKRRPKLQFKERMYRFLRALPDVDALLAAFWDANIRRVKLWYLAMRRDDDVVISASPEFLLQPAMERLGIRCLMASRVDRHTGLYDGLNCHGEEKVRRFRERFPQGQVEAFYSDSLSDAPMARLAQRAMLVHGDERRPWPEASLTETSS